MKNYPRFQTRPAEIEICVANLKVESNFRYSFLHVEILTLRRVAEIEPAIFVFVFQYRIN